MLIVDDDALMRAGLRGVLASDEGIELVGEADDGRQAAYRTRLLEPDVVVMDVRMPDLDGISATREVLEAFPDVKVVILTTFEQDDYIFGALSAGASGFLLKRTRPEELIAAIHTIAAGDSLLSPSVTSRVIEQMAGLPAPDAARDPRLEELTAREREVLEHVARGLSNAEIAAALVIEESTVKTHVKRILAKLAARDRVQAVIFAYETGLIRPGLRSSSRRVSKSPSRVTQDRPPRRRQQGGADSGCPGITKPLRNGRKDSHMIRKGDRLENPVTGEILIFHKTSEETDGESVLVETIVSPDGCVAAAHVHPSQSERFEVLDGQVGLKAGARRSSPGPARS